MQQSGGKVKSKVILEVSQQFPKPNDFHPSYGTGGFRDKGDKLSSTLFR